MSRAENASRAAALKAQGLNGIQIAERMGVSRSYAYELLSDPEGHVVRARKDSYRRTCLDCGAPTDGSNGPNAPERCLRCGANARRRWTRKSILEALRRWNELHGRPPGAQQWLTSSTPGMGSDWPYVSSVVDVFGSWNAAIIAAGFEPMYGGHKRIELKAAA